MQEKDQLDLMTQRIIGAAIEVHKGLGPGLLESADICGFLGKKLVLS
jgi:hypothetical protein